MNTNEELQMQLQKITQKKLDDHEERIRDLEESNTRMSVKLEEINTGQMKLQNMLLESEKERSKHMEQSYKTLQEQIGKQQTNSMAEFTKQMADIIGSTVDTNNKVKITNHKQFWLAITAMISIVTIIVKYFFIK